MRRIIVWIPESQAAKCMGFSDRRWFRRLVRTKQLPINYTSRLLKGFFYNKVDIDNYLFENLIA